MTDSFPGRTPADDPPGDRGGAVGRLRPDADAEARRRPRAAAELLIVSYGARQHIRRNALHHLHQEITITRKHGSFTLEESLTRLIKSGAIDRGEALVRANHPDEI